VVAGGAGAHERALDRRDDERGERAGLLGRDALGAQRLDDRRLPAAEGGGRGSCERRVLGARVLQGAAAALIAPTSLALVLDQFPPERRATGVGLWGAAAAFAAACGPTLGRGAPAPAAADASAQSRMSAATS
jgi:hypothetical protein